MFTNTFNLKEFDFEKVLKRSELEKSITLLGTVELISSHI